MPPRQQAVLAELKRQQREQAKEIEQLREAAERVKQMERQLKESRSAMADAGELETVATHYRDLFEGAPEAYLVTDPETTIKEANRAAGDLLGTPPLRLIGLELTGFVDEANRRVLRGKISNVRRQACVERWEMRLRPLARAPFDCAISLCLARDLAGGPSTLRWCLRDESHRESHEPLAEIASHA